MESLDSQFAHLRPKALAALTRQFRDLDLAEDAFGEACVRALKNWPERGIPSDPLAWLLTVARNVGIDQIRKSSHSRISQDTEQLMVSAEEDKRISDLDRAGLRDDVLRLLFICCHPSLSRHDQLALALKIVAGLKLEEVARAFLVKPRTMEQRLTRAKRTIAANPVPFETPDMVERSRRLGEVSLMIYLLFNEGWSSSGRESQVRMPLCEEAIRLARLLLDLFPSMAELMGLLALLLFQHARSQARVDARGVPVPLDAQDRGLWDAALIREAQTLLDKAARHKPPGPYQLQAMIAGVHAQAASDAATDWPRIERLYGALYLMQPTPVVRLNQAAVAARTKGAEAALGMIAPLETELQTYRWYHAMRGELLMETRDFAAAKQCFLSAAKLNPTEPELLLIREKIVLCEENL